MPGKLAPYMKLQFFDANGDPLSAGKLYAYANGTSNPQNTYQDLAQLTLNANPIILDAAGRPPAGIWLTTGQVYTFEARNSADVVQWSINDISGVNDQSALSFDQWTASGVTPTFISTTSFSVPNDVTTDLQPGRRLKFTTTGGTVYGTIVSSSFGAGITTVVMAMDSSGNLDAGLSVYSYAILTATNPTLPSIAQQTLASAATVNIASARGAALHISGAVGITSFGNAPSGLRKAVIFDSNPQITHNAASMILLGGATRTVAAGDIGMYESEGAGNWRELMFCKASGAPVTQAPISASLGGDVALNNTGTYFDGPTIAQGVNGTWLVIATVTVQDSGGAAAIDAKLWDGTTTIDTAKVNTTAATNNLTMTLVGFITGPVGNLRVSARDVTAVTGLIKFNASGNSKDSSITAIRIA